MSDEERAFQMHLDKHPDDATARLVFADWLQDRDDPRAEGYRALGTLKLYPWKQSRRDWTWHEYGDFCEGDRGHHFTLPAEWWSALRASVEHAVENCWPDTPRHGKPRNEVEDAAALAFAKLPGARRAELLTGQPTGTPT